MATPHSEIDISDTIAPNSDQLDAVDLLAGPMTFTVEKASKNNGEQPVSIKLVGFPRVYRPGKSMRRVLVAVWGKDAAKYAGRRLTLFCDQGVKFGGVAVGGVRISHMSHIEKQTPVVLLESRGKSIIWKVDPLVEEPPPLVSPETLSKLGALFEKRGIAEDARLPGVSRVIGRTPIDVEAITEDEARQVISTLEAKP